jgi:hypothetical protein
VFSEADLAPPEWERKAARRALLDTLAASVAIVAVGAWMGGLVALGWCVTPRATPSSALVRFDTVAVGCAATALACEIVRTLLGRGRRRALAARVRRVLAIGMALLGVWSMTGLTPSILRLRGAGAQPAVGTAGTELVALHAQAELCGTLLVVLGVLLVALHVFTLQSARDREVEDDGPAPLPPGPSGLAT